MSNPETPSLLARFRDEVNGVLAPAKKGPSSDSGVPVKEEGEPKTPSLLERIRDEVNGVLAPAKKRPASDSEVPVKEEEPKTPSLLERIRDEVNGVLAPAKKGPASDSEVPVKEEEPKTPSLLARIRDEVNGVLAPAKKGPASDSEVPVKEGEPKTPTLLARIRDEVNGVLAPAKKGSASDSEVPVKEEGEPKTPTLLARIRDEVNGVLAPAKKGSASDSEVPVKEEGEPKTPSLLERFRDEMHGVLAPAKKGSAPDSEVSVNEQDKTETATLPNQDRDALEALYQSTNGERWRNRNNWLSDAPLGDWHGIETVDGRVTKIDLDCNHLDGELPDQLGKLTNLEHLSLSRNRLAGQLPKALSDLSSLRHLQLTGLKLSGVIPPELGNLQNLECLNLSDNDLRGPIPAELGALSNLRTMVLARFGKSTSRHIPPELGNLQDLERLDLSGNGLTGAIPANLGNLSKLRFLDLRRNRLSYVPRELGKLKSLEHLNLSHNSLNRRKLPSEIFNLPLDYLGLDGNTSMGAQLSRKIDCIAPRNIPLTIRGETGTGKRSIAHRIHEKSGREGHFVHVRCGDYSEEALGSTVFGHAKGAFPGAVETRSGALLDARGGTLFLDAIHEMPVDQQGWLLFALQYGEVTPIGSDEPKATDVRVVCATNCNLEEAIAEGRYRFELHLHLNACELRIPPLRERPDEDFSALVAELLVALSEDHQIEGIDITPDVVAELRFRRWEGNDRELKSVLLTMLVEAMVDGDTVLKKKHIPSPTGRGTVEEEDEVSTVVALYKTKGNVSAAAHMLGVVRKTVHERINRFGLTAVVKAFREMKRGVRS